MDQRRYSALMSSPMTFVSPWCWQPNQIHSGLMARLYRHLCIYCVICVVYIREGGVSDRSNVSHLYSHQMPYFWDKNAPNSISIQIQFRQVYDWSLQRSPRWGGAGFPLTKNPTPPRPFRPQTEYGVDRGEPPIFFPNRRL